MHFTPTNKKMAPQRKSAFSQPQTSLNKLNAFDEGKTIRKIRKRNEEEQPNTIVHH